MWVWNNIRWRNVQDPSDHVFSSLRDNGLIPGWRWLLICLSASQLRFSQHLVIPLVWCLTPKKTQNVYEKIFKVLKRKATDLGWNLAPQHAYLDFEVGAINALEKVVSFQFDDRSRWVTLINYLLACFLSASGYSRSRMLVSFHSVYLSEHPKDGSNAFLRKRSKNPTLVKKLDGAASYQTRCRWRSDRSTYEKCACERSTAGSFQRLFSKPVDYAYSNEILEYRTEANTMQQRSWRYNQSFENIQWQAFSSCLLAYNNRLQYRFGEHPSLWSFIRFLQNEESLVSMKLVKIKNGISRNKDMYFSVDHERARTKTNQLQNLARLYTVGTIGLNQYVNSLATFTGDFTKKKKVTAHANPTALNNQVYDDEDA